MDPLTLLAMANGAVAAVKKGCQLYKDMKAVAGDASAVLKDIQSQFAGKKVSKEQAKKIEEKKAEVREAANADPNDVISRIGENLGAFFDAFDKIEQLFWEEERKAKVVYSGDESLGKRALNRVLIRTRLEQMHAEIRQEMTWNTPQELGDLWSRFEKMREQMIQEQEIAREAQRIKDQQIAFRKREFISFIENQVIWAVAVVIIIVFTSLLLWSIKLHNEGLLRLWLV